MSTLLEQASLVLIPSGYKEDTVYSVIPSNGSGDMSFTRASDGTRINSDGLVENTPWNLFQQSETFENASWSKTNTSITANTTTAPNGTLTADALVGNGVSVVHDVRQTVNATGSSIHSISVYLKQGTERYAYIVLLGRSVTDDNGDVTWVDLELGTLPVVTGSGTSATISLVGNGWYKVTMPTSEYPLSTQIESRIGVTTAAGGQISTASGFIYLWGAQLNIGSTAKPYFPTTDRLNVPRLTYQNGGGGCPSLLLEPQRTNLVTYSEQFDNVAWTKDGDGVGQSVTANYSTSPDGTQNADRLQLNKTGGTYSRIMQNKSGAGTYALTVYMKSNTSNTQNVGLRLDSTGINCAVTPTWQRFTLNATVGTPQVQILLFDSIVGNDETADISIWGAQLEVGAYASSYIPTTSASATRIADVCSKTGISSLIGQTEGSVFVDVNLDARVTQTYFAISSSATAVTNYIGISFRSGTIVFEVVVGGLLQASATLTNSSTGRFKLAIGYKLNDFAFYANGSQIGVDNIGTVPACNDIVLFNNTFSQIQSMKYNQTVLFKTRLTNSELLTLSTI
jgi:hypothetical protein